MTTKTTTEPVPVKPGYLSTEFWLTLAAQAVAALVLFGFVSKGDAQTVQDSLSVGIQNAAALAASALSIWKYIQSRGEVKSSENIAKAATSNLEAARRM